MNKYILLIMGMSAVTLIPRIAPLIFHRLKIPPIVEDWIRGIPFAALASLTIPGIIKLDPATPLPGLVGLVTALSAAILKAPMYLVVLISLFSVYIYYMLTF